ncbi:MAG: DUF2029 domain-containing protein [Planctomycetes bacterium]|nr:DUF2029 domain-containing protein [Planctomycetota bacterium]
MRRLAWPLVVLLLVVLGLFPFLGKGTSELPVYTEAGARMLAQEEIYRPADEKPFSYPPFFAVAFVPFALLPQTQDVQRAVWYFANVGALIATLAMLWSIVKPALRERRQRVWFWVGLTALTARHVLAVFQNQSHDLLVGLAITLAAFAWGRARGMWAGWWAGLAGACKATPLLFGLPFVAQRRWRAVVGIGLGFAICSLVPDVLFPRTDGRLWLVAWFEIMVSGIGLGDSAQRAGVWHPASILNQSLSGTIYRLTTHVEPELRVLDIAPIHLGDGARKTVTMLGQLAVAALIGFVSLRRVEADDERRLHRLGLAGCVACGMVLLSPMSSKSHFCVLLLPVAYCLVRCIGGPKDRVLAALLWAVFALGTLTTKGVLGRSMGELALAYGAVTWATVVLLLAAAHGVFWTRREDG